MPEHMFCHNNFVICISVRKNQASAPGDGRRRGGPNSTSMFWENFQRPCDQLPCFWFPAPPASPSFFSAAVQCSGLGPGLLRPSDAPQLAEKAVAQQADGVIAYKYIRIQLYTRRQQAWFTRGPQGNIAPVSESSNVFCVFSQSCKRS